jgi:heme a synthase
VVAGSAWHYHLGMAVIAEQPASSTVTAPGPAPIWLRRIFIANLVAQTGIVVTGGLVRLTGSGLGCPTWPQCAPGSFVPTEVQEESWHKYVEFGNRLLTFVLAILAIAAVAGAVVWMRRLRAQGLPSRRPVMLLAIIPLVGTLFQAVLGGITVLTGLNPATVAAHFLVSALLIAACVVLVHRSAENGDRLLERVGPQPVRLLAFALVAVAFFVLVLGTVVTGSGPHSGDADTPARFPFDPAQVAWLHADSVLLFIGLMIGLLVALKVTAAPESVIKATWVLIAVSLAQGVVGYVQYFTGLPWLVVLLHLLGACLVWIAVLRIPLRLRVRG